MVVHTWGFQRNCSGADWYLDKSGSVSYPSLGSKWVRVIPTFFLMPWISVHIKCKVFFVLFCFPLIFKNEVGSDVRPTKTVTSVFGQYYWCLLT